MATTTAAHPANEPEAPRSARATLILFFSQQWEDRDQAELPQLVKEAVDAFRHDESFLLELVSQSVHSVFYDLFQGRLASQRAAVRAAIRRQQAAQDAGRTTTAMPSWSQWLEKVQEGAFKRLPAMNRLDLRSAIDNHQRIINDHMQSVRFLTALADGLPDDETTVLSHYGEAGVTAVFKVANP